MKFINQKTVGIVISLLFIGILISMVDVQETICAFSRMNLNFIWLILPAYLISYVVRALRWRILLSNKNLKFHSLLSSIFIGFSLNCILPARAGEIYRAYFFGKKENIKKTKVFTSVIMERIFDGITLFSMLCFAIYIFSPGVLFTKIACSAGLVFIGSFMVLLFCAKVQAKGNRREKTRQFLIRISGFLSNSLQKRAVRVLNRGFAVMNVFFDEIKMLNSYIALLGTVFYSIIIWLSEGFAVFLVIKSFGVDISYLPALLVLSVTAFSTLIPAGPAGVGPYQWGYILALGVFGVTKEMGLAISVTNQLLVIMFVVTAGAIFGWKEHICIADVQKKLDNEDEQEQEPEMHNTATV